MPKEVDRMDTDMHKHFGDLNLSTEDSKSMNKYARVWKNA
jgi:hypothetical protein